MLHLKPHYNHFVQVKRINYIQVKPEQNGYNVVLSVTSIDDNDLNLNLRLI